MLVRRGRPQTGSGQTESSRDTTTAEDISVEFFGISPINFVRADNTFGSARHAASFKVRRPEPCVVVVNIVIAWRSGSTSDLLFP